MDPTERYVIDRAGDPHRVKCPYAIYDRKAQQHVGGGRLPPPWEGNGIAMFRSRSAAAQFLAEMLQKGILR